MASLQSKYDAARANLTQVGQEHVLTFWADLDDTAKAALLADLDQVDLKRCAALVEPMVRNRPVLELPHDIQPPEILPAEADAAHAAMYAEALRLGEQAIAKGQVAAFVVAGGQGSRLGYDGPKGAYQVTLVRNAPLFQVFAEALLGIERRYGRRPPWYVMTGPANHEETQAFFTENKYFGLSADDVRFFMQGQMPAFHPDGRIMLASKSRIALSPDGHGGSLRALSVSGALDDMKRRGVEHISYFQVDNPLVRPIDPLFIGLHIMKRSEMSSKAVTKADDKERVGNFCIADGKLMVIEYSDLPDELAVARNADGTRRFDAGSIAIHVLSRAFVERLTSETATLHMPWHRAEKKVPTVNDQGNAIDPDKPNGVKLEMFVFDAIPLAENALVMYTRREEEFSPVKNATGVDSAVTARRDLNRRAARWLASAGVEVPMGEDGEPAATIEISPAFALDAEDLRRQLKSKPAIKAGDSVLLA
ncbi:MAG: UDPGP type 1 family protein [Phycisphaerae bacterium]|nr:UDPGP type 1 family protein [Phycisphaerae bacterium]